MVKVKQRWVDCLLQCHTSVYWHIWEWNLCFPSLRSRWSCQVPWWGFLSVHNCFNAFPIAVLPETGQNHFWAGIHTLKFKVTLKISYQIRIFSWGADGQSFMAVYRANMALWMVQCPTMWQVSYFETNVTSFSLSSPSSVCALYHHPNTNHRIHLFLLWPLVLW